jgi:formamidopyrimidine-DNA glycosylase
MPELPDVEGFKAQLDETSLHKEIAATHVHDERILDDVTASLLGRRLKGAKFTRSRRHGKHLFAKAGDAGWLVLHFGMTGSLAYEERQGDPPGHARVVIDFANDHRLAYICRRMLGKVGFAEDIKRFIADEGLGPDALAEDVTLSHFREMMRGRSGSLKGLLMDQSFIAGIGNVWSDEILYQATLHPKQRANDLSDQDVKTLHRTMRRVLEVGAQHGGRADELPNSYMLPHREEGASCPKCNGEMKKITVAGRSAYICPDCQKEP